MKGFISDIRDGFLNHIVRHIPSWHIRKICYRITGMTIGNDSHILMGVYVMSPHNVVIGDRTYVNERCLLDGRGGLTLGDDVSLSIGTQILTSTHDSRSESFKTVNKKVVIENNVWTGIGSIVLPGTTLHRGCILGAGSVAVPSSKIEYGENEIYSGVPAKLIGKRDLVKYYQLGSWKPHFR